jgi:hypothetical protein
VRAASAANCFKALSFYPEKEMTKRSWLKPVLSIIDGQFLKHTFKRPDLEMLPVTDISSA